MLPSKTLGPNERPEEVDKQEESDNPDDDVFHGSQFPASMDIDDREEKKSRCEHHENQVTHMFLQGSMLLAGEEGTFPPSGRDMRPLRSHATRAPSGQALGRRQLSLAPAPSEPSGLPPWSPCPPSSAPVGRRAPLARAAAASRRLRKNVSSVAACSITVRGISSPPPSGLTGGRVLLFEDRLLERS